MIETEKKYKLTKDQFDSLIADFSPSYYTWKAKEENIIYNGGTLSDKEVLRLRNVHILPPSKESFTSILTYKGLPTMHQSGVKFRVELETNVHKDFVPALECLGFKPVLVYEKIRTTCDKANPKYATVCFDELPFGYYMEIEGTLEQIEEVEKSLSFKPDVEMYSYPELTHFYGKSVNGVREARFS